MERIGKQAVLSNICKYYVLWIFFIGYYIIFYIYYWSGEWLAHRLMEGIEAVLVVVAGSVMQGPAGDQVVLNNHGDHDVTTYSAKW